jgi:hypothetical protein
MAGRGQMGESRGDGSTSIGRRRRGRLRRLGATYRPFLIALSILPLALASGASADPLPGTPVAVEPGVPGNGRAWELMTPADPVNSQLFLPKAISASGDQLAYTSLGPLPGAPSGFPLFLSNITRRQADGWVTTPVALPYSDAEFLLGSLGPEAFSPNFEESIWTNTLPDPEPGGGVQRGIFRRGGEGHFDLLARIAYGSAFKGASDDLQHVVFWTDKHLLATDAGRAEGRSIYEVAGPILRLVDVDAGGSLLSDCGSTVAQGRPISRDGRRIFFTTQPSCSGPTRAYLREDGLTTTLISASQCTLADCGPEADVSIVGTTPTGSSAFLVTEQRLTDDDEDALTDLYRYDVASGELSLLSSTPAELAVTSDPLWPSDDGARALFWAADPSAPEGKRLYLAAPGGPDLVAPSAAGLVELSADGRFALLETAQPLVAGDADESVDVYRYDDAVHQLALVSSGSIGGNGLFDAHVSFIFGSEQVPTQPYRAMSTDGSDIFFGTAERLLPQDRNEVGDVYEWNQGALALVSAGAGDRPSVYLGATPDGKTAFFRTTLTLVPRDRDGGDLDYYAARVGGGFPEPATPAQCPEESCLPPLGDGLQVSPPATAVPRRAALHLHRPSAADRRAFAATGWITLLAEAPRSGGLSARAWAKVGHGSRLVASSRRRVRAAGPVRLRLRLSAPARHALAQGRDLRVRVVLRLSRLRAPLAFVLAGRR